ncbi:MAG TPA: mechanosensitive ion channel family protein [Bryobacteraceae bacterium]|nr:mechanosensitive ion channel family protein [Bryobacteraceae bacterium]
MSRWTALAVFSFLMRAEAAQLAGAKSQQNTASAKPADQDHLGRDTPHGCAQGFLRAASHDDYSRASQYLDTHAAPNQAQELARQLKVVLDLGLSGNIGQLPRTPDGDLEGGLPADQQRIGFVKTKDETLEVVLNRVQRGTGPPIWLFSAATLRGVPRAFNDIESEDIARYFPEALRRIRFLSLPIWRWLAIFVAVGIALTLTFLLTRALMPLLGKIIGRITGNHDEHRLASLRTPLGVILFAIAIRLQAMLAVSLLARQIWRGFAEIFAVVGVGWLLIRFTDIVSDLGSRRLLLKQASDKMALLAFARRMFKVFVVLVAVIILLRYAGVNVTAMLAGLGIGGVAVALAAQKTIENFFGGILIILREVVRVGDFCKIADQLGNIEDVGFGATRVRTLDRTVVSVPNGLVSQTNIENYTMRDKIWFHHVFGLRYDTSVQQVRRVLSEIGKMLSAHPKVETVTARIRLIEFGRSSLDIEVFAYVLETDYALFLIVQEELLLRIMELIEASGSHLAIPSQISYLERGLVRGGDDSQQEVGFNMPIRNSNPS